MEQPPAAKRILVVDDEPSIIDAVATSLRYEGFDVTEARQRPPGAAVGPGRPARPHRARRDAARPRRLRGDPPAARQDGIRVPILFLTARDAVEDKVAGLTVGGDDYVTKPFALAEVVARVHAILRRIGAETPTDAGLLASPTSRWTRTPTR